MIYDVAGVPVEIDRPPFDTASRTCRYGNELRELMVVPAVAVNVNPRVAVVPESPQRSSTSRCASSCWNNVAGSASSRSGYRQAERAVTF